HEEREPEWARGQREQGAHGEPAAPARLKRAEREQREREPQRERECGGDDDPRREDGERAARETRARPPLADDDCAERKRARCDRENRQHPDADERGERVVENAVGDERIPARVPEVVPDREAVLKQERAL